MAKAKQTDAKKSKPKSNMAGEKHCGKCRKPGHNARTCPTAK